MLQYRLGLAGIGALRAERRFPSSRAEVPEEEVPCHPDDDKVKLGPPPPPGRDLLDGHIPGDQQAQIWNHFLVFSCKKARRLEVRKATLEKFYADGVLPRAPPRPREKVLFSGLL